MRAVGETSSAQQMGMLSRQSTFSVPVSDGSRETRIRDSCNLGSSISLCERLVNVCTGGRQVVIVYSSEC